MRQYPAVGVYSSDFSSGPGYWDQEQGIEQQGGLESCL